MGRRRHTRRRSCSHGTGQRLPGPRLPHDSYRFPREPFRRPLTAARRDVEITQDRYPFSTARNSSGSRSPEQPASGAARPSVVKFSRPALIWLAAVAGTIGSAGPQANEPTEEEIARAYRSKSGQGGTFLSRARWERWRVKEIRGWKLHFQRISEKRSPGVSMLTYEAVATKKGLCADYRISDTMTFPAPNPQMQPILVVELKSVKPCR